MDARALPPLGAAIGPATEGLILTILAARPHPEQGFRTCLGVLRLYRDVDKARAEAVSERAVTIGGLNYTSIASLLRATAKADPSSPPPRTGEAMTIYANLRGPGYFH